ncbi:MAG: YciI family protein [Fimbriimonadaceae bacterium]
MKFLVAIHHADNYDPSTEGKEMGQAIDELNDEMVAAGIRIFVGGLHHASTAKSISINQNGETSTSDGSYLKTDEHVGGFWVLEVASMEEALNWGRKAALACKAPVEVRQFH